MKGIDNDGWEKDFDEFALLQEAVVSIHERLVELKLAISPNWLSLIDRTEIEKCSSAFNYQCPRHWDQLTLTTDRTVRFCPECKLNVHFCSSMDEARQNATAGRCVAIASSIARAPHDLPEAEDLITMGLIDVEALRKLAANPWPPITARRLPLPLVQRIRGDWK